MNKQALAFLTMFSLILMLSVYYVTLPADSTTVMKEESSESGKADKEDADKTADSGTKDTENQTENKEESTSKESRAVALQDSINQKKEEEINKNSSIVGDSKKDESAKKEALATIDELKSEKSSQQSIIEALKKEGYTSAVEINDNTCIVTVFDQKDDKEIAKKVMQKTSEATNNKYLIEVTFK